jgi:ribosomal protein L11 methyltransferase
LDWIEVSIDTVPEGIDAVCARLIAQGTSGFEIEDEQDFEEFLENNRQYWDYVDEELRREKSGKCRVNIYIPDDASSSEVINSLRGEMERLRADCPDIPLGSLEVTVLKRGEEEWAEAWKKYYKAVPVGNRLFIRPEWESEACPEGRIEYISNPGMAFGTGTHASTRLCMLFLENVIKGGESLLDLGCGSGILSITGLLLGAKRALGVDIDPIAVDISASNAALNHVEDRFTALYGNVIADKQLFARLEENKYDVITANIVADVIIALGEIVGKLLKPDGFLIVSGIIDTRAQEVADALISNGFQVNGTFNEDGWCAMSLSYK